MNKLIKPLLFPLWFIYGFIILVRNKLFDFKILKSYEFHVPVISVGNITVGGTGKTPHTEYLIRLLKDDYKIAFLSRGYKRKTRGFVLATEQSNAETIGDEPFQIKRKFPDLLVAVDRNRVKGIKKLIKNVLELDIILLDDAYQHRTVNPGINILLIDYNRPIKSDSLLPIGRLREPAFEKKRADIIIVTKVLYDITSIDKRIFLNDVEAQPHQTVYFTSIDYGKPLPVFSKMPKNNIDLGKKKYSILLVTGIADPSMLIGHLSTMSKEIIPFRYPDHYSFSQNDIAAILEKYHSIPGNEKIILTTEKDAVRLISFDIPENEPEAWYYIPMEIVFLSNDAVQFNHQILQYVKNNNRNSILYKK
jgi:tetraacyldisaccharide 4'-kinase